MKKLLKGLLASVLLTVGISTTALADQVLIIDAGYSNVTQNVQGRLEAAGHTVTVTTDVSTIPTATSSYQQVWDLRYAAALTAGEVTNYTQFVTAGGFAYFVTENPGCCMSRNNSVAQLVTDLGGGSTQIGPGWANNIESNVNTTYMTSGITVNFAAIAAIVNSQGIPLIGTGNTVGGMSWIGRAGALGSGVLGTIVTVADTNWLDSSRFAVGGTTAQQQNVTALDDIIRGIVAGTVGGTISAQGNGAASQQTPQQPPQPTTYSQTDANQVVVSNTMAAGTFTGNGGALQAATGTTEITNNMVLNAPGMVVDNNGQTLSLTGSVSGAGGWTFTNTSNGGSTTLNGTYTYTGPTNINSSATVVNNSNISTSSLLTNLGQFTNSSTGTTGNWVNGFNGDGNTAVVNNAGTMGNGINYSTFNNTGTVGNTTNVGTFNNTGSVARFENAGVLNNNAGGTVAELAYNNHWVSNNGTITTVTYNGGTVNNAGTIGSINNTEAHGTFHNTGTITGTVTTNSTLVNHSGATIAGLYTNNGALTNAGSVGAVTNTGTFTNTGTVGSLNNSGTFTTNSVTLGTYTQSSTGSTTLPYGSAITTTGAANIDGSLTMIGNPYSTGKYTVLTGNGVTGTFSNYTGVGVLRYTPTGVQIWVMPDGSVVQAQVNNQASNLSNANTLASGAITGAVGSDCSQFGEKGGCVSVNYGSTKAASGELNSGGVTVAKSINDNWRVGVFGSQHLNTPTVSGVKFDSNSPAVGAFVGWTQNPTGTGFGVTASTVRGTGNYTIGTDKTGVTADAYQVRGSYTIGLDGTTVAAPYIGVRRSNFTVNGYTEQGPIFPLTYSAVKQSTTDLLAGVVVSKKFSDKLTGSVSAGVVQNIADSVGSVASTSDMGNHNAPLKGGKYTSSALGAGLSYEVLPNQRIGANFGWQQKSLTNASITSYGVSYTVGF